MVEFEKVNLNNVNHEIDKILCLFLKYEHVRDYSSLMHVGRRLEDLQDYIRETLNRADTSEHVITKRERLYYNILNAQPK